MLSSTYSTGDRKDGWKKFPGDVMSHRDYAERLTAKLNQEIVSTHFGGKSIISMEGCAVKHFTSDALKELNTLKEEALEAGGVQRGVRFTDG